MLTLKRLVYILAASAAASLVGACSVEECLDNQNSLPLAGFYSVSSPGAAPSEIAIGGLTVRGIGAPNDTAVISSESVSEVYLPFRIDEGSTDFEFTYELGEGIEASDIIGFTYDIEPYFASAACGAVYKYKIKDISWTTNYIDSVTCPTGVIDNTPGQNIRIYFRTTQEESQR